ncbi:putative glycolipid-binding domain-containing protein [Haladaptatus sp. T7]|uniref:putative glycolipid-binding domain-containing protein n=1 Tax=Haladaptatus sp. T7 TaxID=2029368 RepID=UPI0021A2513D|nr:putative glycolipid-binding domain-containing protein [Haladaptatus sp. T7]GKZ14912.1 hypothetical protein HAL_27930 [Haladaptatus sp. T7]
MERHVVWEPVGAVGTEHLTVEFEEELSADGTVVGTAENEGTAAPFRVRYRVACDETRTVRRVEIDPLGVGGGIKLEHDGDGNWTENGVPAANLAGCRDVDISVTPFTNTVPIRRHDLASGETARISVVYLDVPAMTTTAVEQRYTCLEPLDSDGGVFRYESLESGFTADLPVDSDGVVLNYPSVFRRAYP